MLTISTSFHSDREYQNGAEEAKKNLFMFLTKIPKKILCNLIKIFLRENQ